MAFALKKRFSRLDGDTREVMSGALLAFILRGVGAGLAFVFNIAIARMIGAEGAGLYFTGLSLVMIASVVARLGLDNAMLRFIASGAVDKNWPQINTIFGTGMRGAGAVSAAIALAVMIGAPLIASVLFDDPRLVVVLRVMACAIITFSMMMLLAQCLKGLKRIRDGMLVSGVIYPLVGLGLIWPLGTTFGVVGVCVTYVLATGSAALIGWLFWTRARTPVFEPPVDVSSDLWGSARPLWGMQIITAGVLPWLPILFLGVWGTAEETGILGAATRVSTLVSFFLVAINNILAPKFAELFTKGNMEQLKRIARRFALVTTLAASPVFLVLIFAGDFVLGIFGKDFSGGGDILAVLIVGQVVNTMTGSVGMLLMMTGNERAVRNGAIIAAFILIIGSFFLIPGYGALGAAAATSAAVVAMNLFSVFMVRKRLGFWVIPWVR